MHVCFGASDLSLLWSLFPFAIAPYFFTYVCMYLRLSVCECKETFYVKPLVYMTAGNYLLFCPKKRRGTIF